MYAVKYGYDVLPSSELKALGLTNMVGSMFQSFVVMGAFGRSAVNDSAGARSQLSGIIATATVIVMLLVVMPALYYLPKAVLSAMIIIAVKKLIDWDGASRLWRLDKRDFLIMLAAFLATLFMGVLWGVVSAMLFSLVIFVGLTTQPQVFELGRMNNTGNFRELGTMNVTRVKDVKVLRFAAPLFFANSSVLKDRILLELVKRRNLAPRFKWKALVLDFSSVSNIDSTSIQVIEEIAVELRAQKVPLLIANAGLHIEELLVSSGLVNKLGRRKEQVLFPRVFKAVEAVLHGRVTAVELPTPSQKQVEQRTLTKRLRAAVSQRFLSPPLQAVPGAVIETDHAPSHSFQHAAPSFVGGPSQAASLASDAVIAGNAQYVEARARLASTIGPGLPSLEPGRATSVTFSRRASTDMSGGMSSGGGMLPLTAPPADDHLQSAIYQRALAKMQHQH
jgi:anti-anti-sigma regulatory factor